MTTSPQRSGHPDGSDRRQRPPGRSRRGYGSRRRYFLWNGAYQGECEYTLFQGDEQQPTARRDLAAHDIFIRDDKALGILEKVLAKGGESITEILTNREPFKYESNFRGFHASPLDGDIAIHYTDKGKRGVSVT